MRLCYTSETHPVLSELAPACYVSLQYPYRWVTPCGRATLAERPQAAPGWPPREAVNEVRRRQRFRSVLEWLHLKRRDEHVRVWSERGVPRFGLYGKDGVIIDERLADDGALVLTIRFPPDDDYPPRHARQRRRGRIVQEWSEDERPAHGRVIGHRDELPPDDQRPGTTQRRVLWLLTLTLSVIVIGTSVTFWKNFHPDTARDYYVGFIAPFFQLVLAVITLCFTRGRSDR